MPDCLKPAGVFFHLIQEPFDSRESWYYSSRHLSSPCPFQTAMQSGNLLPTIVTHVICPTSQRMAPILDSLPRFRDHRGHSSFTGKGEVSGRIPVLKGSHEGFLRCQ